MKSLCSLVIVIVALGTSPLNAEDSQSSNSPQLETRVYTVADLVVPIPRHAKVALSQVPLSSATATVVAQEEQALQIQNRHHDFKPLINTIQQAIGQDQWEASGGRGSIQPYERNLSLVIRQTTKAHHQITSLLSQMRSLQNIQVVYKIHFIKLRQREWEEFLLEFENGVCRLSMLETKAIHDEIARGDLSTMVASPQITTFDDTTASIETSAGQSAYRFSVLGRVSDDRRSIDLACTTQSGDVSTQLGKIAQAKVSDGRWILIDPIASWNVKTIRIGDNTVHVNANGMPLSEDQLHPWLDGESRTMILVRPKINILEEEEVVAIRTTR